ncbi:hypothetical protein BS78_08G061900 [Paspalum vaginatum]|nr:hypothetical protein BS78_08G061900 [Paspalum vaginatum]
MSGVCACVCPVHVRAWRAWPRSYAGMQMSCGHGASVDRVEATCARSCIGCDWSEFVRSSAMGGGRWTRALVLRASASPGQGAERGRIVASEPGKWRRGRLCLGL